MKRSISVLSLCIAASMTFAQAVAPQDEMTKVLTYMKHAMLFNAGTPQEKAYLHFDNTGYFKGERIWFKAYVVRADNGKPTDISKVLYVELVNPSGDVVATKKLRIENGMAKGGIPLNKVFGTGFYEVRAYTRYMTNWGNGGIFSRVFPVFAKPESEGDYSKMVIDKLGHSQRLPNGREKDAAKVEKLNVRFFPEGGNLVLGLKSRVAFTVSDAEGRPVAASGKIFGADGSERGTVLTDSIGRSTFEIVPDGQPCTLAMNDVKGKTYTFNLPEAVKDGCVLRMDMEQEDEVAAELDMSAGMHGKLLGYTLMHNGNILSCDTLTASGHLRKTFSRQALPAGVSQFTVFDSDGHIQAERLFFVCPPKSVGDSVRVTALTENLAPCGKVRVKLEAVPNASLSFSAMDVATMTNGKVGNAMTWMLLSSEVKGYIDNPDYYFEADDTEHRRAADLLMMVQGWRRYDWRLQTGNKGFDGKLQLIEDKLYLSGKLMPVKKKNTVDNVELRAFLYNKIGEHMDGHSVTDSLGNYAFELPDVEGEWNLQIKTKKEGADINYRIGIDRRFSPLKRNIAVQETDMLPANMPNLFTKKKKVSDDSDREEYVSITRKNHVLPTVKIKGRYFTNDLNVRWYNERSGAYHASIYYNCDEVADSIADEGGKMMEIYEWLATKNEFFANEYPNDPFFQSDPSKGESLMDEGTEEHDFMVTNTNRSPNLYKDGYSYKNRPLIWIVDNAYAGITNAKGFRLRSLPNSTGANEYENFRVMESTVAAIPTFLDEVKSIYISEDPRASISVLHASELQDGNAVTMFLYTHPTYSTEKQKGLRRTHFQGYNVPSTFEMEDYSILPAMDDFRRTLYWEPDVKIDSQGKAIIEFYNNSGCKEMYISTEGFTPSGRFVVND
ncbi:MAG: hypothetical protein NC206_04510 [Bacteroides sp.]|nr:hypothetical protein [Roseburia sp.]MCM1346326.1 hypothetical protein [Bacteroides sp.]MCM1420915.1 hypothetical protein [Bacteroides sp.]